MSDCGLPRPLLEAWLDGEGTPEESGRVEAHLSSCEGCRDSLGPVVLGVGLLFLADPAGASPPAGFTGQVMDRIRAEGVDDDAPPVEEGPGKPGPRAEGVDDDAPPSPVRPSLPAPGQGRLLHIPRPVWAGIGAAAALAAAAGWLLLTGDPATTVGPVNPEVITPAKTGSVAARDGGVLRWTGPFDGVLTGSVWVAKDAAVPTSAGELLHSPASSSFLTRLPEGGRLDAGPSSWLVVGGSGEAAILAGGFTGIADGGIALNVDTPAGRVTVPADGEVEISIGAATGGGPKDAGMVWLGAWAASRRGTVAPGIAPDAPPVVQVIYARRGSIEVAASGPVRNSLERTTLRQGQALVILESKVFLSEGVDDDGPPDSSRWMDGLPVPPGSKFFRTGRRPAEEPAVPPGGFGATSGPVRNSLERSLADTKTTPEERAYALSVYESMGGPEAVAAGVKAVDDPAIEVRCAALHLLAVTASADRPAALAGLRRLAQDDDDFIARFAILALKTLRDVDAIPVLRAIAVDDDAPPDGPKREGAADGPVKHLVAKVYALDALVALGDRTLLAEGAALLPLVEADPTLHSVLSTFVIDSMASLQRVDLRALSEDRRPGVQAAAILALADVELAEVALASPQEAVRLAAARVILDTMHTSSLERISSLSWSSDTSIQQVLTGAAGVLKRNPSAAAPDWLVTMARSQISSNGVSSPFAIAIIQILDRASGPGGLATLLHDGSPSMKLAALRARPFGLSPELTLPLLGGPDTVASDASLWSNLVWLNSTEQPDFDLTILANAASAYSPNSSEATRTRAFLLAALAKLNVSSLCLDALNDLATSPAPADRQIAATAAGMLSPHPDSSRMLTSLIDDPDPGVARAAAFMLSGVATSSNWPGPPLTSLYPSPSSDQEVRMHLGIAACQSSIPEAQAQLRAELGTAPSGLRRKVLSRLRNQRIPFDSVDSPMFGDPDPAVRTFSLLIMGTRTPIETLRASALDPNLWVRATALALLMDAGELENDQQLRELMPFLASSQGWAGELLRGYPPSEPIITPVMLMAAETASTEGSINSVYSSENLRLRYLLESLSNRGFLKTTRTALSQARFPPDRTVHYGAIKDHPSAGALQLLADAVGSEEAGLGGPQDSALSGYSELVGFIVPSPLPEFHQEHRLGFLTTGTILERND